MQKFAKTTAVQARAFSASVFVTQACERNPEWLREGRFESTYEPAQLARLVAAACTPQQDEAAMLRQLRQLRQREMTRIAFRDIAGWAMLDETLRDLSDLADACCTAAVDWSLQRLSKLHGPPGENAQPLVLGMGKLGGRELNFSSDIDLIFCYTEAGETTGARPISNEEFFGKMVQDVTRLLATRTEDGFVFRVDWMLRPFGSAGPPAVSAGAMEQYYQTHGREWERYALIKARPVAGDLAAGEALLKTLRPFVYRRYLDFNAIGALRELKRMIEDELARKNLHDNIKLGHGGIREVEFIVQAAQLIRGGQNPRLRDNRLRPVLAYLGEAGIIEAQTAADLDAAYVFLRRTENAIQMYADQQTHAIPTDEAARTALCAALELPDWASFMREQGGVRERVRAEFGRVFRQQEIAPEDNALRTTLRSHWHGNLDSAAAAQVLAALGFAQAPQLIIESLESLRRARLVRAASEGAVSKLLELLSLLLQEALLAREPETAATRVLKIVHQIAGRSTYLTLLRESATARGQLVKLCAASPWLTELLAQSPALLDALLNPQELLQPPTREQMRAELHALCAYLLAPLPLGEAGAKAPGEGALLQATAQVELTRPHPNPLPEGEGIKEMDTEAGMDILRRYQKETTLRVAAADLLHDLALVKVSDHLTWLAEVIVQQALALVWAQMRAEYGQPLRSDGAAAVFGVIAYGKFGGIEMSYGSDLDLVFLHDCDALDTDTVGGPRALPGGQYMARLAQRLTSWLSTHTGAGRAYEVDLELGPDGRRGMSVSSLAGFTHYQAHSAWTWEHQALSRARYVAGDDVLGRKFFEVRRQVLMRERDPGKLSAEIADMRAKMRAKLDKSGAASWDIKQGVGGMIDIEFITQFLLLRDAHKSAEIVEWSDNWRQLDALERLGSVSAAQKASLIEVYRKFRSFAHVRGLQNEDARAPDGLFASERETIRAIWKELFEGST